MSLEFHAHLRWHRKTCPRYGSPGMLLMGTMLAGCYEHRCAYPAREDPLPEIETLQTAWPQCRRQTVRQNACYASLFLYLISPYDAVRHAETSQ
jgi:hypothetical protein